MLNAFLFAWVGKIIKINKYWWNKTWESTTFLWIKRIISLWTDLEINLEIFTMNKWQSIILLWNKCKFWDFSIVPMTWNLKHVEACSVFCAAATRNKICYQTQQAIFNAKFPAEDCFQALSWKVLRSFKNIFLLLI